MSKTLPPTEVLWELLEFAPLTGEMFWRIPKQGRSQHRPVGTKDNGYRKVVIDRQPCLLHRVIWKWVKGVDPSELVIDHIDRNRSNNRIHNLRVTDAQGNGVNKPGRGYYLRRDVNRSKPWCVSRYAAPGQPTVEHYSTEAEAKARAEEIYQTRMDEPPVVQRRSGAK